jgi:hypothetical protein
MPRFFYQCPNKGFQVIAITPEGISEDDTTTFVPVHCYVCGEVHQVIPATGEILATKDADAAKARLKP